MQKKRIIFLDIDGTLCVPGENVPPPSAQKAIRQAQKAGHIVVLCSGRNYPMLSPLLAYGFDGVIASTGGYIDVNGKVIFDCPMTREQQKKAMEVFEKNGVFRTIEGQTGSYTDEGFKEFLRNSSQTGGNSELLRWREQIEKDLGIRPMAEYNGEPIYKIVFMSPGMEPLKEPQEELKADFNFCIQDTNSIGIVNGELINKKYNKGTAVHLVADYFGIPVKNTIAFGDSMNDLEMIEAVEIGICMANGSPSLQSRSDGICPAVDANGLYRGFEQYGLL